MIHSLQKACLRSIKQYKPYYIVADKAYDTEPIRKLINEELNSFDIIPIKPKAKTGLYRLKSTTLFRYLIYLRRNNVESIFSVIKRKFNGNNGSISTQLQNKETKFKGMVYNIYRSIQLIQK
ncbi:transposase [Methanosphaera sp. WGK6]|uniref:transposase n=1 Tax=Methanosphaera sp. WGK6 TaxID=1561964 RepID=UPI0018E9DC5C|nr:transposase [Methanosphaera sp. WGK6]